MESSPLRRPPKHVPVLVQSAMQGVGKRLVTARKLRGLTAEQLAQSSDVSLSTLRALESGADGVAIGNFLKVLKGLGLLDQVDQLLDPARDPETVRYAERMLGLS